MLKYVRVMLGTTLAALTLISIGCGGGPEQASESEGMMDDMSAYGAPADPAALSGAEEGTPEATTATP